MKVNLPVSDREYEIGENAILMSTTDTSGRITYS